MILLAATLILLTPPAAVNITVPRVQEPIAVDGALDEPGWATAAVREDFVTSSPVEGREPSQATRVRIMRDDERDATVARLTSQLFFTRSISLRVIADWDGVGDLVAPSVLLGWRPGPGTVVYAGWQNEYSTESDDDRDVSDRQAAFMKLSYLFGSST